MQSLSAFPPVARALLSGPAILLAFCSLLASPYAWAITDPDTGLVYRVRNGEAWVQHGLVSENGRVVIPETLGGYPVIAIDYPYPSPGFYGNRQLKEIIAPSVIFIFEAAFLDASSLTSISMPKLKQIQKQAFDGCTSLSSVSLPEVTSVGSYVFGGCTSLSSVSLPKVTSIGASAFEG